MTLLLFAALLGVMVFFVAIISPAVFASLDAASGGRFLRHVFPRLFVFGLMLSALATAAAWYENYPAYSIAAIGLGLGFFINGFSLTPKINAARDAMLEETDSKPATERHFKLLHGCSVGIYLLQMVLLVLLLGRHLWLGFG